VSSRKIKISPTCLVEGYKVTWDEARIVEIESNRRYRKCKKSAHMADSERDR
jgi:hypothetical protein